MKNRLKNGIRAAGLGLAVSAMLFAIRVQADSGGSAGIAGAFLTYGAGARAIGMGRAFAGLADDATALVWNPGGLSGLAQNQAVFQHAQLIDQNTYEYLGYAQIFPYTGTLAAGVLYLNQGAAEGRDTYNVVTDSFRNQQLAFLLGFGTDVFTQFSAGGAVKVVNQAFANLSATGFGLDLGFMYRPFPYLNIGLNLQNLVAPSLTLKEASEAYPLNVVLGVGTHLLGDQLRADFDLVKNLDQSALQPRFGVEVEPIHDGFLRAGIDDTEIGIGAGYRYQGFQLDYALGLQTLEMMHKISLTYSFGGFALEVRAEPDNFSPVGIKKVTVIKIDCQTKVPVKNWTLEIFNEASGVVKKYSGEGFPPDHIVWNGLKDDSNPMPDERYRIVLTLENTLGEIVKAPEAFVVIQSVLPLGVSPVEMLE